MHRVKTVKSATLAVMGAVKNILNSKSRMMSV